MEKKKIVISEFDAKLILEPLKNEWMKNASWENVNPESHIPNYWYVSRTKKAKQLESVIKYIEKQLRSSDYE